MKFTEIFVIINLVYSSLLLAEAREKIWTFWCFWPFWWRVARDFSAWFFAWFWSVLVRISIKIKPKPGFLTERFLEGSTLFLDGGKQDGRFKLTTDDQRRRRSSSNHGIHSSLRPWRLHMLILLRRLTIYYYKRLFAMSSGHLIWVMYYSLIKLYCIITSMLWVCT